MPLDDGLLDKDSANAAAKRMSSDMGISVATAKKRLRDLAGRFMTAWVVVEYVAWAQNDTAARKAMGGKPPGSAEDMLRKEIGRLSAARPWLAGRPLSNVTASAWYALSDPALFGRFSESTSLRMDVGVRDILPFSDDVWSALDNLREQKHMKKTIGDFSHPDYHGPWYCINKTSGRLRGLVLFNVAEPHTGNPVPVSVDDTFLAINLLDKATKQQLSESADLRTALERGMLVLVDEEEALDINSRAGASSERRRIKREQERASAIQSASYGGASGAVQLGTDESGESGELVGIHPRLWNLAEKVRADDEITVINSLRAVIDELTAKDLRYARKIAREEDLSKLFRYATSQIRKRKAGGSKTRRREAAAV